MPPEVLAKIFQYIDDEQLIFLASKLRNEKILELALLSKRMLTYNPKTYLTNHPSETLEELLDWNEGAQNVTRLLLINSRHPQNIESTLQQKRNFMKELRTELPESSRFPKFQLVKCGDVGFRQLGRISMCEINNFPILKGIFLVIDGNDREDHNYFRKNEKYLQMLPQNCTNIEEIFIHGNWDLSVSHIYSDWMNQLYSNNQLGNLRLFSWTGNLLIDFYDNQKFEMTMKRIEKLSFCQLFYALASGILFYEGLITNSHNCGIQCKKPLCYDALKITKYDSPGMIEYVQRPHESPRDNMAKMEVYEFLRGIDGSNLQFPKELSHMMIELEIDMQNR